MGRPSKCPPEHVRIPGKRCADCHTLQMKAYYVRNKERIIARQNAYQQRRNAHPLGVGTKRQYRSRVLKTHCAQGHPWTEENTYYATDGSRKCRACGRELGKKRSLCYRTMQALRRGEPGTIG